MTRDVVPQQKLFEILNAELHEQDPCGQCRFTRAPAPLRMPDETGCNWSQCLIVRTGSSGSNSCARAASRVISQVAACFNLMSDHVIRPEKQRSTDRVLPTAQPAMRSRETDLYFQIDTNRINARGTLTAMNRLEKWHDDEVIGLVMSDVAYAEAKAGRDMKRSRKTVGYIYSLSYEREPNVRAAHVQIAAILFPGGRLTQSDINDVRIVSNALKYQYILVTADGVILRNRDALAQLGLRVMTDDEAVQLVEQTIRERDAEALDDAAATGEPLPHWVGKD